MGLRWLGAFIIFLMVAILPLNVLFPRNVLSPGNVSNLITMVFGGLSGNVQSLGPLFCNFLIHLYLLWIHFSLVISGDSMDISSSWGTSSGSSLYMGPDARRPVFGDL